MKTTSTFRAVLAVSLALGLGVIAVATHGHWRGQKVLTKLPPPPAGITDLKFNEFFVLPVGPLGLVPTEKLRSLEGKRVRMLGYMVRQEKPPVGTFLFAAIPAQIHEHDNALADDLPPATVRVAAPTCREKPVPFAPDLMALTGTLHLGNRADADGRVTFARLELDPPPPSFFKRLFSGRPTETMRSEEMGSAAASAAAVRRALASNTSALAVTEPWSSFTHTREPRGRGSLRPGRARSPNQLIYSGSAPRRRKTTGAKHKSRCHTVSSAVARRSASHLQP